MSTVAVFYRSGLKFWLEPIERKCNFSLNRIFLPPKHHFKVKKVPYFRLKDPIIMHPSWSDQISKEMIMRQNNKIRRPSQKNGGLKKKSITAAKSVKNEDLPQFYA